MFGGILPAVLRKVAGNGGPLQNLILDVAEQVF